MVLIKNLMKSSREHTKSPIQVILWRKSCNKFSCLIYAIYQVFVLQHFIFQQFCNNSFCNNNFYYHSEHWTQCYGVQILVNYISVRFVRVSNLYGWTWIYWLLVLISYTLKFDCTCWPHLLISCYLLVSRLWFHYRLDINKPQIIPMLCVITI